MEYGLTDKGFVAKPFTVILEEERQAWKDTFGYDIDTSTDTPEGAYVSNQAIKLAQLWEKMEGLWAVGDPDSASGVYLDRLASLVNVEREDAQSTRVYEAMWGVEGTPILAGHLARLSSGEQFALSKSVKIGRDKLLGFLFKITSIEEGEAYSITINGRKYSYTAVEDDDEAAIQQGLFDQIESVAQGEFAAKNMGEDGMEVRSAAGIVPFAIFCDDDKIEFPLLGAYGVYLAVVPGATFAAVGTLNKIVSNVSGLDHITNYATGITGREVESDPELRIGTRNRQKKASGNEKAIENELGKVPGVIYRRVYSNRSKQEVNGRPPNSYEAVVVGGVDQEIAEKIFDKGPGGIQPFGNTIVEVLDSEGFPWEIGFTRPSNRYIWLKITFQKNHEESFPINGVELLKNNIDVWGAENQKVGVDFIYQNLYRPIYSVPGIRRATILVAVSDDLAQPDESEYEETNVDVDERQIAIIDRTRINIEEVA